VKYPTRISYSETDIALGVIDERNDHDHPERFNAVRVMEKALYSSFTPFLNIEWSSGAFAGSTPEQAYFVRCDRSTMTQVNIDIGRLV